MNIKEFIAYILNDKSNKHIKLNLGIVPRSQAEKIKNITGLNVLGYTSLIDNYAVKHTLEEHGTASEIKRGQVPVTPECFELIPTILSSPDKITDGGLSAIGRRVIVFSKRINGIVIYVEEVRTKRKELALLTMYIKKARC